eukprot:7516866-Ditylum_brightwellii.AAC.1
MASPTSRCQRGNIVHYPVVAVACIYQCNPSCTATLSQYIPVENSANSHIYGTFVFQTTKVFSWHFINCCCMEKEALTNQFRRHSIIICLQKEDSPKLVDKKVTSLF